MRHRLSDPAERPFDYHTMTQLPRQSAADSAILALDAVQRLEPEAQMLGVAVLFAAMCHRVGVNPSDMHTMGSRVLRYEPLHRRANDSIQALQDYAGLRIKGDPNVSIA